VQRLQLLIVAHDEGDAREVIDALTDQGYEVVGKWVDAAMAMNAAINSGSWSSAVVIWRSGQVEMLEAIRLLRAGGRQSFAVLAADMFLGGDVLETQDASRRRADIATVIERQLFRGKPRRPAAPRGREQIGVWAPEPAADKQAAFTMDGELRYTSWNQAAEELIGIEAGDVIGRSLYEIFPHAAGTAAERTYLNVLATRQPAELVAEYCRAGEHLTLKIEAHPHGEGLSVAVRNVTQTQDSPQIRCSRTCFESLCEDLLSGVVVVREGVVEYVNPTLLKMLGYVERSELLGTPMLDHVEPRCRGQLAALLGDDKRRHARHRTACLRKDGSCVGLYVATAPLETQDGPAVVMFIADPAVNAVI